MDINLTLWGWIVGVYFLSMISLSYYLGKKKTDMPVIATFIGGACSLIPPLVLIYLAALLFKKNKESWCAAVLYFIFRKPIPTHVIRGQQWYPTNRGPKSLESTLEQAMATFPYFRNRFLSGSSHSISRTQNCDRSAERVSREHFTAAVAHPLWQSAYN